MLVFADGIETNAPIIRIDEKADGFAFSTCA
jgi:hypothetical protein